ncbi:MAG: IPTL-CTERM sorting domain-containing protein [Thermoanaerobaculia bacterium]
MRLLETLTGQSNSQFGTAVAFSADGDTALVGAPGDGAAYVFLRSGDDWILEARLPASGSQDKSFGTSVALSPNGAVALVGAPFTDCPDALFSGSECGAVYAFARQGGVWQLEEKLTEPPFGSLLNRFGISLALSGDGSLALIGAPYDYCEGFCGAVFVFNRNGGAWDFDESFRPLDFPGGTFGFSISLTPDGNTALISAPFDNCGAIIDCGAVYVYEQSGGTWIRRDRFSAPDPTTAGNFGISVALSADATVAVIGAVGDDCPAGFDCGAVYVFERIGGTWTLQRKFESTRGGDQFGFEVALSDDGRALLIVAPFEDCAAGPNCGAVYRSVKRNGAWTDLRILPGMFSPGSFANAFPRDSLALSADGELALVGLPGTDCANGVDCGSALIFAALPLPASVPTLGEWGLILLAVLLAASGTAILARRRRSGGLTPAR